MLKFAENFEYNAACQFEDGSEELLDLEVRGWADKERLSATRRFSLVPKEGVGLPVVAVHIPPRGKPVFKSRVFGTLGTAASVDGGIRFRTYAIGWKRGRFEHLIWVLPTGDIEVGPEPAMGHDILKALREEAKAYSMTLVSNEGARPTERKTVGLYLKGPRFRVPA